jgi:hypothetical protein
MSAWWLDTRMLDAGDARGLTRPAAADIPDAPPRSPRRISGDLDAAAERLGVDVADLVAMRRKAGIAPSHRRPGLLDRLAARIAQKG